MNSYVARSATCKWWHHQNHLYPSYCFLFASSVADFCILLILSCLFGSHVLVSSSVLVLLKGGPVYCGRRLFLTVGLCCLSIFSGVLFVDLLHLWYIYCTYDTYYLASLGLRLSSFCLCSSSFISGGYNQMELVSPVFINRKFQLQFLFMLTFLR